MKALSTGWLLLTNDDANVAKAHDISCSLCGQMWWFREIVWSAFLRALVARRRLYQGLGVQECVLFQKEPISQTRRTRIP